MAKYAHIDVLDGGLNAIRNKAEQMLLLKSYSPGDSFDTVVENAICAVDMTAEDYLITGEDCEARVLTVAAKEETAYRYSGPDPELHIAFTDGAGKVLLVTDETAGQAVPYGSAVHFPVLTYTSNQPG